MSSGTAPRPITTAGTGGATWKLDGGGALMNQSIHTIDLLYYLAGDVATVSAFADRTIHERIEVEDIAVAILRFQNGAVGVIEGSTACYSPTGHGAEVHLCGSAGSIFMRDDAFTAWDFKTTVPADRRVRRQLMAGAAGAAGAGVGRPIPKPSILPATAKISKMSRRP